jgi:hypothetical protein
LKVYSHEILLSSFCSLERSLREPASFDIHFSDAILLKRIEHRPSLVQDIAVTVDNTIIDASRSEIKLSPPEGLLMAKQIEHTVVKLDVATQGPPFPASIDSWGLAKLIAWHAKLWAHLLRIGCRSR